MTKKSSNSNDLNPEKFQGKDSLFYDQDVQGLLHQFHLFFDDLHSIVYAVEIASHEVIYQNEKAITEFNPAVGKICWKAFCKEAAVCNYCPLKPKKGTKSTHVFNNSYTGAEDNYHVEAKFIFAGKMTIKLIIANIIDSPRFAQYTDFKIKTQNEEIRAINEELIASNEALIESENKALSYIDNAVDGIILTNKNGGIIYTNRSLLNMSGYSHHELDKQPMEFLFDAANFNKNPLSYNLINKGKVVENLHFLMTKDKKRIPVSIKSKLISVDEIQTIVRDVTEWVKREELNLQFKTIFESAPDSIFQVNNRGIIVRCNNAFAKDIGLKAEDLKGKSASDFVVDKKLFNQSFKQLQKEHYTELTVDELNTEGKTAKVWRKAIALFDVKNKFVGAIIFSRNIEQRIKDEEYRLKLTAAVEQSANSIIITNTKGIIEYVNNRFVELTGYEKDDVVGMNSSILKSGKQTKSFYSNLWKTISSGKKWHGEFNNRKKDGTFYWELSSISPIFGKYGQIINYIAIKEDITVRKEMEAALHEKNKKYEELNKKHLILEEKLLRLNVQLEEKNERIEKINSFLIEAHEIGEIGTWEYNLKDKAFFLSEIAKKMFGYQPDDKLKYNILEQSTYQEEKDEYIKVRNESIKSKLPYYFEKRIINRHNKILYVREQGKVYSDKDGKPIKLSGIIQNITKQKLIEKELRKSEKNYRNIFNSPNECIFIHDIKTGQVVDVNATIKEMYGYLPEEVIGTTVMELSAGYSPYTLVEVSDKIKETKEKGKVTFDWLAKRKDSSLFWAGVTLKKGKIGSETRIIAVVRDISKRKQQEDQLLESEERFRIIVENSPDFIMLVEAENLKIVNVNSKFENTVGLPKKQLLGKSIKELGLWVNESERIEIIKRIKKEEIIDNFEGRFRNKPGQEFICLVSIRPIILAGKKHLIQIARDITKRKQTELALAESEEKFRELAELSPTAIFISQGNKYIYVNDATLKITGFSREELFKMELWGIVHPDMREEVKENALTHLGNFNLKNRYEIKALNKNGQIRWVDLSIATISYKGQPAVIGNMFDITVAKLAEKVLLESEERFRGISKATFEAVLIIENGVIIELNDSAMDLFGYQYHELIDIPVENLVVPNNRELIKKNMLSGYSEPYEAQGLRNDGSVFYCQIQSKSSQYKGKKVRVSAIRDITNLKLVEKALIEARKRAEKSDKLKTAFLANMSHEIRTPMNAIFGFSELLGLEDITEEFKQKYTAIIRKSCEQLLHIIDDILDISRLEVGEVKIIKTEFNLNELLDEIYESFATDIRNREKKIGLYLDKCFITENAFFVTDKYRIKQIISNLISNALKFTNKGSIWFGYHPTDSMNEHTKSLNLQTNGLLCYVKDTGDGIELKNQRIIFDRFRQSNESHTRILRGTGLGLSISKALVELLGGEIGVQSKPGEGSLFYFVLPVQNRGPGRKYVKKTHSGKKKFRDKTILIVEDDEIHYLYLCEMLKGKYSNIIRATNGNDAVSIAKRNNNIGLILMDIQLPGLNGYKTTTKIKKFNPSIPIVAQTAYALEGDREKALQAGCDGYISKPIIRNEMIKIIEKLISD